MKDYVGNFPTTVSEPSNTTDPWYMPIADPNEWRRVSNPNYRRQQRSLPDHLFPWGRGYPDTRIDDDGTCMFSVHRVVEITRLGKRAIAKLPQVKTWHSIFIRVLDLAVAHLAYGLPERTARMPNWGAHMMREYRDADGTYKATALAPYMVKCSTCNRMFFPAYKTQQYCTNDCSFFSIVKTCDTCGRFFRVHNRRILGCSSKCDYRKYLHRGRTLASERGLGLEMINTADRLKTLIGE